MADTTFVDNVTLTAADWFNDLNRLHYTIFGDPADDAAARSGIGAVGLTGDETIAGTKTFSSPIVPPDGTVGAPGIRVGTSSATGIFSSNDNTVRVACNGTQEGVFSSSGLALTKVLDLSAAASGQIVFPATQNASANANTLDDYEEGTWTPGVAFGGGTTGLTYTTQAGKYTKIGNRCLVDGFVNVNAVGSSTGDATFTGLPFTVVNASSFNPFSVISTGWAAALDGIPFMRPTTGGTTGVIQYLDNASSTLASLTHANFNTGLQLSFAGHYPT